MKRTNAPRLRLLMLTGLLLLAGGCASVSQPLPPVVVQPPITPSLPAQARQPPPPEICSPTCSQKWSELAEQWLQRLTAEE